MDREAWASTHKDYSARESIWVFYETRWIRNKNWSNSIKSLSDLVTCYNSNFRLFCLNSVWEKKSIKWNATVNKGRWLWEETSKLSVPVEELLWENTVYISFIFVPLAVNSEAVEARETSRLVYVFNVMHIIVCWCADRVSVIALYLTRGDFCSMLLQIP